MANAQTSFQKLVQKQPQIDCLNQTMPRRVRQEIAALKRIAVQQKHVPQETLLLSRTIQKLVQQKRVAKPRHVPQETVLLAHVK